MEEFTDEDSRSGSIHDEFSVFMRSTVSLDRSTDVFLVEGQSGLLSNGRENRARRSGCPSKLRGGRELFLGRPEADHRPLNIPV